jgi:hypothetical protein
MSMYTSDAGGMIRKGITGMPLKFMAKESDYDAQF